MKKRMCSCIFIILILNLFNTIVFASNPFSTGQCTWYAYQRWTELLGYEPSIISGNAGGWYDNATSKGFSVGSTPKVGAIACWNNGFGDDTGHVAIVESVNSDSIYISEYNWTYSKGFDNATVYFSSINRSSSSKPNRYLKGYIYLPGTSQPDPTPESNYIDIGTSFCANIIQSDSWATIGNVNDNAEIVRGVGDANEYWWFERQSDGSYTIESLSDNKFLDVETAGDADRLNIHLYDYTGADNQRWYIKESDYGRVLIPKCALSCCMDCCNASTSPGTNIQLFSQNGTEAQGFNIYKHSGKKFVNIGTDFCAMIINTKTWLNIENNNGNAQLNNEDSVINCEWKFDRQDDGSYIITSMKDDSVLDVDNAGTENATNIKTYSYTGSNAQRWYIYGSSGAYELSPKCADEKVLDVSGGADSAGVGTNIQLWEINETAAQKFQIWMWDDATFGISAYNNLGNEFDAYIKHTESWSGLTNSDLNACFTKLPESFSNVYWHFIRNKNGSYCIISAADGKALTVSNGTAEAGTNVELADLDYSSKQQWYIYGKSAVYKFKSRCSDCVLDLSGGTYYENVNAKIYTYNDSTAQKYQVWKVDLENPIINVDTTENSEIKFSWTSPKATNYYNLQIYNSNNEIECEKSELTDNNISVDLPDGSYTAIITAVNGINKRSSEVIKFDVLSPEPVLSSVIIKTLPTKLNYHVGDVLDTAGLIISLMYNDETTEDIVSGFTCSPTTLDNIGAQTIQVDYCDKSTSFTVNVIDNTIVPTRIDGDINGDGKVNERDATYLLRYLAGWELTDLIQESLDVDGSGTVNEKDATIFLRYLAGWNVELK